MSSPVFISHASKDDEFVTALRLALEAQSIPVWVDSRNLRGGNKLAPEIAAAIKAAPHFIAVLSPNTINSPWVRKEINLALQVKKEGYSVIPILLPGVEPSALALWFDEEPVGIKIELKTGALSEALPAVLTALGKRAPEDPIKPEQPPANPVEELRLKLSDPKIEEIDKKRRVLRLLRRQALTQRIKGSRVQRKAFFEPSNP